LHLRQERLQACHHRPQRIGRPAFIGSILPCIKAIAISGAIFRDRRPLDHPVFRFGFGLGTAGGHSVYEAERHCVCFRIQ